MHYGTERGIFIIQKFIYLVNTQKIKTHLFW